MNDITKNEMGMVLRILKSPHTPSNANSIAKPMGISAMGALKIARRLEKEEILISKKMGHAQFFGLNLKSAYVRQYIKFLLMREARQAPPYVRAWLGDLQRVKSADAAILYCSVLQRQKEGNDIDVLFILDSRRLSALQGEIDLINQVALKRIHPLFQTKEDFTRNIKKEDKPLLNVLKGVVAFGEDRIIEGLER